MRKGKTEVVVSQGAPAFVTLAFTLWRVFYLVVIGFAIAGVLKAYNNAAFLVELDQKDMVLMDNVSDLNMSITNLEMDVSALNMSVTSNSMSLDSLNASLDTVNMSLTQLDMELDSQVSMLNTSLCAKIEAGDDNLQMQLDTLGGTGTAIADLQMKTLGNMMNITLLQDKDMQLMNQIMAIGEVGEMLSNTTMDLNVTVMQALIDAMALEGRVTMVEAKALQNMMDILALTAANGGEAIAGNTGPLHVPQGVTNQFNIIGGAGISTTSTAASLTVSTNALVVATTDAGVATASTGNINFVGGGGISTSASGDTVTITGPGITEVTGGPVLFNGPTSGIDVLNPTGPIASVSVKPRTPPSGEFAHWCIQGTPKTCGRWETRVTQTNIGPYLTIIRIATSDSAVTPVNSIPNPLCFNDYPSLLLCRGDGLPLTDTCNIAPVGVCEPFLLLANPLDPDRVPVGTITLDSTGVERRSPMTFTLLTTNIGQAAATNANQLTTGDPTVKIGGFTAIYPHSL